MSTRKLRESQRRRLSVRFGRLLEEAEELGRSLDRLQDREPGERSAGEVAAELQHLIELVRGMAERFDLSLARRDHDALDQLEFWSAVWWTRVLDCRSAALTAVGPVDPAVGESLDEAVNEIAAQLTRIRDLAQDSAQGRSPGS